MAARRDAEPRRGSWPKARAARSRRSRPPLSPLDLDDDDDRRRARWSTASSTSCSSIRRPARRSRSRAASGGRPRSGTWRRRGRQARRRVRPVGDVSGGAGQRPRWCRTGCSRFSSRSRRRPPASSFRADREAWARDGARARRARRSSYDAVHALPAVAERSRLRRRSADSDDPYAQPVSALRRMLIETTVYGDLSLQWIREQRPDLAVVYFQGTDTIGHVFAPYAPPRQPSIAPAGLRPLQRRARAVLPRDRRAHRRVPRRRRRATGGVLMLASDHGFYWGEGRPTTLSSVATASAAKWHAPQGMYLLWGTGVPAKAGHAAQGDVQQVVRDAAGARRAAAGARRRTAIRSTARRRSTRRAPITRPHYQPAAAQAANGGARRSIATRWRSCDRSATSARRESDTAPPGSRGATRTRRLVQQRGRDPEGARQAAAGDRGVREGAGASIRNLASAQWNLSDVLFAMGQDLDRVGRAAGARVRATACPTVRKSADRPRDRVTSATATPTAASR